MLVCENISKILTPKSEDEIKRALGNLDPNELLIKASKIGYINYVKKALEQGADVHTYDDYALQLASENGHVEVVKLLLDNGANVHANNDDALRWASGYGHTEVVKLLKQYMTKNESLVYENINKFLLPKSEDEI